MNKPFQTVSLLVEKSFQTVLQSFNQPVSVLVNQADRWPVSQGVQSSIQLGSQSVDAVSQSVSQGFRQSVSYSVGQSAGQGVRQQTGRETFSQLVS